MSEMVNIPGIGQISKDSGFIPLNKCSDGIFEVGKNDVLSITATGDRKVEFVSFDKHTLAYVSFYGLPGILPDTPCRTKEAYKGGFDGFGRDHG